MKCINASRIIKATFLGIGLFGFTANAQVKESKEIKERIALKKEFNKEHPKSLGYKIQLFNGSEDNAKKVKYKFQVIYPEFEVKLLYKSPEFKVRAGNFKTKLEADKVRKEIKDDFPSAIVIKTKIDY